MTNSPLGQYAPLVATVTSLVVIGGYVGSLVFLNVNADNLRDLQALALIAIGAVFGSAVSVNGWRQPLAAAHTRIDALAAEATAAAAVAAVSGKDE